MRNTRAHVGAMAAGWALAVVGASLGGLHAQTKQDTPISVNGGSTTDRVEPDEPIELEEIVVSSRRQIGSVIGDIEPELQLSARDIRNLGVSNVAELISALGSQLGSGRSAGGGRPIVLLNGVRVASFREIRDLPSEAILRSDILPEEVALKYGYAPTQRVLNIVLRPRFRAITLEADAGGRSAGGRRTDELEASWLRLRDPLRWQLEGAQSQSDALLEASDPTRSLLPELRTRALNTVVGRPLMEGWSGTLSASIDERESTRRLGLVKDQRVTRENDLQQLRGSGQLQGAWAGWRITASLNAEREQNESRTRAGEQLSASSESTNQTLDADVLLSGSAGDLPAGASSVNVRMGYGERRIRATTSALTRLLTRERQDLRASIDLPIWEGSNPESTRRSLSLNINGAMENLSDFDQLHVVGAGLNARVADEWRVLLSLTQEENAPAMTELGAPEVRTPAVRSFDFLRNETVFVTRIDGGNADLLASETRTIKAGINGKPLKDIDLDFGIEYLQIDSDRLIGDLPLATAVTSLAFSERFERDEDGRLTVIDARPLNLGDRQRREWRWTANLRRPWGPQLEPPARGRGRPDPARFRAFARQGSWQLALTHTLRQRDSVRLNTPNRSVLDLLDGDLLFNDRGSTQQEMELRLSGARNGYGGRLNARWQQGTRVNTGLIVSAEQPDPQGLRFADLTTVDLRLFADLGLQSFASGRDWLRGARVVVRIDNVFDQRQSVTDSAGLTPANYRPELLDPLGRYIELSVRKLFVPFRPTARPRTEPESTETSRTAPPVPR
ncbi:MAG: hypothetical protein EBR00_02495 [Gammaproteobacteria bacterium]|jgi:hypothetical protein|nr:hypothetical protein [Gammaproteobacteria bacterium]